MLLDYIMQEQNLMLFFCGFPRIYLSGTLLKYYTALILLIIATTADKNFFIVNFIAREV